ncbi:MAG: phosphate signaling complex protein PhoU [Alphaproteobacteria bacterium]|nr:phosphate signaling complex protein PhoU [Alphaproteobacteria bacterium]
MIEHTVRSFSADLEELSGDLARMGGLAEDVLSDAIQAISTRDSFLADTVVARDPQIDAMQTEIERKILRVLALRQPLARDLRQTIAALKIAYELERIGDLAKNIAKRAKVLDVVEPASALKGVARMGRLVIAQLKRVLDAYSALETDAATKVWTRDEEVDEHYTSLFREVLTYMMEDPRMITGCTHLLFVAKNLERVGDHCTNIAEEIHFLVTGETLTTERPKVDVFSSN